MHPGVKRTKGGKNQKRIIEIAHELYSQGIDVLIEDTAKDILQHEEDFTALTTLLQTDVPLKQIYKNDLQYSIALERSERIARSLTNHMKTIRRMKTVRKTKLDIEYKKEKIKELRNLPKAYLARKLVKLLPEKELERFIRTGQINVEKKRLDKEDSLSN